MKFVFIFLSAIVAIFIIIQLFAMRSQNGIESYPYSIVKTYETFEVRNYEASLFTSIQLPTTNYEEGSSTGFSILAGYIFGGNEREEKISMTSPVSMSLEDSMTMMFMVPRDLKKENLPKPNQSDIQIKEIPAKTMAAVRFGGWANDVKIADYKKKLTAALDAKGITYTNRFYFLGYNPPFEVLNRRNEVVVELE